ncbi:GNAT family N-acetyltransferase [Vagococcus xieshaowenii]|uniref:N-acetyltransferase n=1 Tax=Vagococcus xieshaowenii TaxID=2562451 RepID=A0A4Z0D7G8_9ENTE|nr:GNAT family N-acetyltransferase [Vagococcus xieshaowenii]QCA29189.1 N-acetyltransferase [Vagococcus xieshaowenii]TFZ40833.1 N-acetyltransferase [Vagococcus xieshaowenii]
MKIIEDKQRFVLVNDQMNEIGEITWSNAGEHMMIIDHTYVSPDYRGQQLAEKLVLNVVEKARHDHKKIIPLCPFAKKEFDQKTDYRDVLN